MNGLLIAAGEGITRPLGQSSGRWQVLGGLGYGPKTVAELARGIGHARQSVQRVADHLAADGLIVLREKPNDRRTWLLELTPAGKEVLSAIYERQVEWSERVMQALVLEQLDLVTAALGQIGDVVEAQIKSTAGGPASSP